MRSFFPVLALVALFFVTGCENTQMPGELTLQTRDALDVLPASVRAVGMINFEEARSSEAIEIFTGGRFAFMELGGEEGARFEDFIAATGFNPDEDLHRVYFAMQRGPGSARAPFFVVFGDYDRARLDAYVGEQNDLELERLTYADAPVYVTARDGNEMAFALVNDDMIVASSQAGVFDMLDRIESGEAGLSADAQLMDLIQRAEYPDDMWMTMRDLPWSYGNDSDYDAPMDQASQMLDKAVVSVDFKDDGLSFGAFGVTRSGASPSDVADILRGSLSVVKLRVESEEALFDVLDRVRIDDKSDGVEVEAFLSLDALRAMQAIGDA